MNLWSITANLCLSSYILSQETILVDSYLMGRMNRVLMGSISQERLDNRLRGSGIQRRSFHEAAQVNIDGLSLNFGGKTLFDNLDFRLQEGDKVTIVGDNGSGKSTLINLIAGKPYEYSGKIHTSGTIGHLPQTFEEFEDKPTLDHLVEVSQNSQLIELLSTPFSKRSASWFQNFNSLGGHSIIRIFHKLGLTESHLKRDFFSLSGGEKVKVHLSGLLYAEPNILLLDEPTNHLDSEGCNWIEHFIKHHRGIVVMVTHDRSLINNTGSRIAELCPFTQKLNHFRGGYKNYIEQQIQKQKRSEELFEKQQKNINTLKKKRDTLGYAASLQVKEKIERLKRDMAEVMPKRKAPKILFKQETKSSLFLDASNLVKRPLFSGIGFSLRNNDRLVITGKNGAGKTTLLEIIYGLRNPDLGSINISSKAKIGFLDQEQKYLDLSKTPVELIDSQSHHFSSQGAIVGHLRRFGLYYEHDFFTQLQDLSIGCRRKAQLAQMIAEDVDVLLLDEPTNHLDLMSLEQIEEQLLSFPGIIIAVSHDRYFIEKIATKTLKIG